MARRHDDCARLLAQQRARRESSYFARFRMNARCCTLALLCVAVHCCVAIPIASSQNLSDQWVENAAAPLVENRVVDGLSIGYIEGEHYGIVHLGSSSAAKKKADNLT